MERSSSMQQGVPYTKMSRIDYQEAFFYQDR